MQMQRLWVCALLLPQLGHERTVDAATQGILTSIQAATACSRASNHTMSVWGHTSGPSIQPR
jgi:hypothetical protein